jgi:hypothetical protein
VIYTGTVIPFKRKSGFPFDGIAHGPSRAKVLNLAPPHRRLIAAAAFMLLISAAGATFFITRTLHAETVTFYPDSCLGGWNGVQHAEGKPDVSDFSDPAAFTNDNAAVLPADTGGDIFCGSFAGDIPPDTAPSKARTIQGSAVDVSIPGDGIFYFHLQLASGGPITHYKIQSDMTPPSVAAIRLSQDRVVVGDVVRVAFDAIDVASGVQRNYYVDLGDHLFLPVGSELFVPFLEAGDQTITLRVYDGAGNYTERTQVVHVNPK